VKISKYTEVWLNETENVSHFSKCNVIFSHRL
jgi:hypothetical protein